MQNNNGTARALAVALTFLIYCTAVRGFLLCPPGAKNGV